MGNRWLGGAAAAAVSIVVAGCHVAPGPWNAARGSFDRTIDAAETVHLDVRTGSGTIEVRAGDGDAVRVQGRIAVHESWLDGRSSEEVLRALSDDPPVVQVGDRVRVGHIEDGGMRRRTSISYEIT